VDEKQTRKPKHVGDREKSHLFEQTLQLREQTEYLKSCKSDLRVLVWGLVVVPYVILAVWLTILFFLR